MEKFDFETVIERRGTSCVKWDQTGERFGVKDLFPMWVADMDFKAPEGVVNALRARVEHGIYGYTFHPESCWEAVTDWIARRHGWTVPSREWYAPTPGSSPHWRRRCWPSRSRGTGSSCRRRSTTPSGG